MRSVEKVGRPPCRMGAAILVMALSLAGCNDGSVSVVPSAPDITKDVVVSQINLDSTFDFFSVDVSMSMTGADSIYQPDLVRSVSYHVERTLDDGVWTTATSLLGAEPLGTPDSGSISTAEVGKIISTSDGSVGQLYDGQGNVIAAPQQVNFDTLIAGREQFHATILDGMPSWPDGFGISAMRSTLSSGTAVASSITAAPPVVVRRDKSPNAVDPRAWIRRYAMAPWQRESAVASLHRRFGDSVGKVGDLHRYVATLDGTLYEALVDSVSGAIVEENVAEGGHLRIHTTHRFTRLPNGVLVHLSDHSEIGGESGSAPRAVIETTFSNMRLETRGGTKWPAPIFSTRRARSLAAPSSS